MITRSEPTSSTESAMPSSPKMTTLSQSVQETLAQTLDKAKRLVAQTDSRKAAGNTRTQTVAVTVTNVADVSSSIVITNLGNSSVAENVAYTSDAPILIGTPIGAVTYTLSGTDAALFSVNASTGVVSMMARNFESPDDVGGNNVYDYTLTATDADGNTDDQAVAVTLTNVVDAGQSVIDLGTYGKLIAPVQVEGKWYYFWDISGDGRFSNTGPFNYGHDWTTHNVLDGIFNQDSAGVTGGEGNTTETYRYATLNGVRVALPTISGGIPLPNAGYVQAGTSYIDDGAGSNGANSSYNDLMAVWDAYNGTGTVLYGVPCGWANSYYATATPTSTNRHMELMMTTGYTPEYADNSSVFVASQVL